MSARVSGRTRAIIIALDRGILWLSRHWLALLNGLVGAYTVLPILAPLLTIAHLPGAAPIYRLYSLTCHQYPERSFFLFGQQLAFCQRDTALYAAVFALGLAFAATGRRWRPLSLGVAVLIGLPMVADGTLQLLGAYESTWWLRTVTGSLAALAAVWFLYPRFEKAFDETGELAAQQLQRALARDRA